MVEIDIRMRLKKNSKNKKSTGNNTEKIYLKHANNERKTYPTIWIVLLALRLYY